MAIYLAGLGDDLADVDVARIHSFAVETEGLANDLRDTREFGVSGSQKGCGFFGNTRVD